MKESIIQKCQRLFRDVELYIDPNATSLKKTMILIDFFFEYKFHGTYLLDYIQYEFYGKKRNEREKYIVFGRLLEIMKKCNNPKNRCIFDQKPLFNKYFSKYLHREWLDLSNATYDEFIKFISNRDSFFTKQPDGMFGKGVEKQFVKNISDTERFFENHKHNKTLIEEPLTQCKELSEFNDTSINTLRVVSLMDNNGNVHIMGGLLRVGRKGKYADNFHHQGICAFIDPKNGIVTTTGVDKNYKRYILHPDSNKQIVGFKIPNWEKVKETVIEAANIFPDMKYIGWDVVITKDYSVALVEGNPGADPDAEQITTREGRWPYYEKVLKEC